MTSTSLLAAFAHPDDETFRPGGMLALLARRGVHVQVLTATRGGAGALGDPPLCSTEELPAFRAAELRCACAALGLQPPIFLDFQDGRLAQVDHDRLTAEILALAYTLRPQIMLTFGKDGLSGHPDHIAIGSAAAEAFRRAEYVSTLYTVAVPRSLAERLGMTQIQAVPDETITLRVDVSAVWKAKLAAIRCHRTQLGQTPILDAPVEQQRIFFGVEYFCLADSRPTPDGKTLDLLIDPSFLTAPKRK